MEQFARSVERAHAGPSPNVERHARNILIIGEMIGVRSAADRLGRMLPEPTRKEFERIYPRVRPGPALRLAARAFGSVAMKRAIGAPRKAVPLASEVNRWNG
jgi:type IV secretory pathway protease TraF